VPPPDEDDEDETYNLQALMHTASADYNPENTKQYRNSSRSKSPTAHAKAATAAAVHFEFGGPWGAFATMVGLPVVIYVLHFACNDRQCVSFSLDAAEARKALEQMRGFDYWPSDIGTHIYMACLRMYVLRVLCGIHSPPPAQDG
jgi:hypothetical protein